VNRELLLELLLEHKARGATIVYITHQMDEVERLADRVMMIKKGRRQLLGSLAEIRREHGDGLLEIEFEGALDPRPETYAVVRSTPTSATLRAGAGRTDQDVLKELAAGNLRIRRFKTAEPSLTDIFIKIHTRGESHES